MMAREIYESGSYPDFSGSISAGSLSFHMSAVALSQGEREKHDLLDDDGLEDP